LGVILNGYICKTFIIKQLTFLPILLKAKISIIKVIFGYEKITKTGIFEPK